MTDSVNRVLADLLVVLRSVPLDTTWSSYESGEDLIAEVERIADGIPQGESAGSDLALLFAPTGALQETAIISGFSDEYMSLAARLDHLK